MKKNVFRGYAILAVLFVLLNVIVFVIPINRSSAFWVTYVFVVIAFVAQISIWKAALGREDTLKSKFLGLPVIHIGIVYLGVQIAVLAGFIFAPMLPVWSAVVVCTLVAGISAVFMIAADMGRNEIERVEAKVQRKVFYLRELQMEVEMLADAETNVAVKEKLISVAEQFRFSDPMSSEQLIDLEQRISDKVVALKSAVNKEEIITELHRLLNERNKRCKILK